MCCQRLVVLETKNGCVGDDSLHRCSVLSVWLFCQWVCADNACNDCVDNGCNGCANNGQVDSTSRICFVVFACKTLRRGGGEGSPALEPALKVLL